MMFHKRVNIQLMRKDFLTTNWPALTRYPQHLLCRHILGRHRHNQIRNLFVQPNFQNNSGFQPGMVAGVCNHQGGG